MGSPGHPRPPLKTATAQHWTTSLPMVLLGVRTALKVDLGCTAAELVYGTSLRLPGDFFPTSASLSTLDPTTYVTSLKSMMQTLQATPPCTNLCPSYVSPSLSLCSHVFIRHDAVRTPLQTPYDGPYRGSTMHHLSRQAQTSLY